MLLPLGCTASVLFAAPVMDSAPMAPTQDDLAAAERALEDSPEDGSALETAAQAALAGSDKDKGLWYLSLALAHTTDAKARKRLSGLLVEHEHPELDPGSMLEPYHAELLKVAKTCESRKLYANAVDLLQRCKGTRQESQAQKRLERLFKKAQVVEALIATGIDLPTRQQERHDPDELARMDAKHSDWDDAYELKGKFYTIQTNMGWEIAHEFEAAMHQMNTFYREVFEYKQRGGSMRRCVIRVFKHREEFDEFDQQEMGVKGYFMPSENSVTTYDPRTEPRPRPISSLWSTLFHEASHQFTAAVWPNQIPTWLNEGTASYFEGARLQPGGSVSFNGIPSQRLKYLIVGIDQGSPTLEEVVTYFRPGSYPGSYYPVGWGLVYFCHNYENDASERVYLPVYREFMKAYKSGGQHDVQARFVEYFVELAAQPGVTDFAGFQSLFEGWVRDLGELHFGGSEMAERLFERGLTQAQHGKPRQAIESLRWALRKNPQHALAQRHLAGLLTETDQDDAALFAFRRLARLAQDEEGEQAQELAAAAAEGAKGIDATVAKGLQQANAGLRAACSEAARALAEADLKHPALQLLRTCDAALGGDRVLAQLGSEVAPGVDARRWRRPAVDGSLSGWVHGSAWSADSGSIELQTDSLTMCELKQVPAGEFRFEVRLAVEGGPDSRVVGLLFGEGVAGGEQLLVFMPAQDLLGVVEYSDGEPKIVDAFPLPRDVDPVSFSLAVERGVDKMRLEMNGEQVGTYPLSPGDVSKVGLFGQTVEASFGEIRLRE